MKIFECKCGSKDKSLEHLIKVSERLKEQK